MYPGCSLNSEGLHLWDPSERIYADTTEQPPHNDPKIEVTIPLAKILPLLNAPFKKRLLKEIERSLEDSRKHVRSYKMEEDEKASMRRTFEASVEHGEKALKLLRKSA